MERQMLRYTLDKLEDMDHLMICEKEVKTEYEIGAVLKYFRNKEPIIFNKVSNTSVKCAGGLYGDRDILYKLLDMNRENRLFNYMNAIANPQPYRLVNNGSVKENIIKRNIDLPRIIPIPKFNGRDSARFITAGVMVVKDPETNRYQTSIRRFQVNGGNNLCALIASPKLSKDFYELEKQNKPMEVAIVLGYDAYFLLASQVPSATYGVDKYEIDSALRGEPLELVKCESVDLLVPAYAEIVLEGRLIPGKRGSEGPFGELMGYYGGVSQCPIIEIDTIMHRNNPIFQVAFPCREEHLANGLIREVELYNSLKNFVDVVDVNVTEGGGYRFNAFVSINKKQEGDGKSAILASLGSSRELKQVVVVDSDVNIYDVQDIEWAITTRAQASNDLVTVEGGLGSSLEPSHGLKGKTDKIGIDATKPLNDVNGRFERAVIPGYEDIDISKYFPDIK